MCKLFIVQMSEGFIEVMSGYLHFRIFDHGSNLPPNLRPLYVQACLVAH